MPNEYSGEQPKPKEAAKSSEAKEQDFHTTVAKQVCDEFKVAEKHIRPWRETKRLQLKLYINRRRTRRKSGIRA
jgi:hypothetical protein